MNGKLTIKGKTIYLTFNPGTPYQEDTPYAQADNPKDAVELLDRAARYQDQHRYTDSARTYRRAEQVAGFRWINIP